MFEKIGRHAEKVATSVSLSRRGFLSRLGRAASGVADVAGALLVSFGEAQACTGSVYQ
jgi:hypothetical protein